MTYPVNPAERVLVVAVTAEKEDTFVYIILHGIIALLR